MKFEKKVKKSIESLDFIEFTIKTLNEILVSINDGEATPILPGLLKTGYDGWGDLYIEYLKYCTIELKHFKRVRFSCNCTDKRLLKLKINLDNHEISIKF